jgi:hypothetical protein
MAEAKTKKVITVNAKSIDLASPKGLVDFATTLKTFIVQQNLYTRIQNKNYVNVEGWQFAGAATGVFPIVKAVERVETADPKEIKYRAEVQLKRLVDDVVVGYGVAICSSKESKRTNADEYVIASMAQTRATGKAYRNAFAWLMKMAGYEATPAEEMDSGTSPMAADQPGVDLAKLEADVKKAKTLDDLAKLQDSLPAGVRLDTVDMFINRMAEIQEDGPAVA